MQSTAAGHQDEEREDDAHMLWVGARWLELRTIKVGMTRGELLVLWTPQGGLSHSTYQSFMSRRCRYFVLDARFEPYSGPDTRAWEDGYDDRDVIIHLSPIMVALPSMD